MQDPDVFLLGDWLVCPTLNQLRRADEIRHLQAKTMDLLVYLCQQSEVSSTAQILEALWPDTVVLEAAVHQRIALIRKALADSARSPRYLETVPGRGYRIIAVIESGEVKVPAHHPGNDGRYDVALLSFSDFSPGGELLWLSEALERQLRIDLAEWPHIRIQSEAEQSGSRISAHPVLLVDGFLQKHRDETVLNIRLTADVDRSMVWSEEFRSAAEDGFELCNQLAGASARYIGWSLVPNWAPEDPAAYSAYLRLLNYRFYGDPDQNLFWLKQTIAADPQWQWGTTELAMLETRNAASVGDVGLIERTAEVVDAPYELGSAFLSASETKMWQLCFYSGKPDQAEVMARRAVPYYETPYAVLLLAAGYANEAAIYFQQLRLADPFSPTPLEWLAMSRANLGDWQGAQALTDKLASLYPTGWVNPQTIRSWTHRRTAHRPESQALCESLREMMENSTPSSALRKITAHTGYYPLAFEVAIANRQEAEAQTIGDWFAEHGYATMAAIVALRLHGKCPKHLSDAAPNQFNDGFWWWLTRLHITPDIAQHPVIRSIESKLGYTPEWQAELVCRASTLPEESQIVVAADAKPIW